MKMQISELTGIALDWAVAKCEGYAFNGKALTRNNPLDDGALEHIWRGDYTPSTNWAQGGPIIEREEIYLNPNTGTVEGYADLWCADHTIQGTPPQYGPTPLIAAMRCYATSRLGDEVDVPEALQ